ncbi:MAG: nucleoside monophosphate kinase, partial [Acidobacteriia bacterium]|nr:nucleoside monophosphate kinase [Terriglobia bacterium]
MIVLLLGPPGCGKGTQATALAAHFQIPIISTGELFRAECNSGTALGVLAASLMSQGKLVDDSIVNELVASRVSRRDCLDGFLLDGYPRTLMQARYLSSLLETRGRREPLVIHLEVPPSTIVSRLMARRQCPQCRRIYNLVSQPSRSLGLCDQDGAALMIRDDDREEVIRERLQVYETRTGPILDWYGPLVHRVPGDRPAHLVEMEIERIARQARGVQTMSANVFRSL